MFKLALVVLAYALIAVSAAPEALVAPAIVTAQSSQYIARNYNALVAPVFAEPAYIKTAAYVAQPAVATKFVAQPVINENYIAQPVLAKVAHTNYVAQPFVATQANYVAKPFVATQANYVAQPAVAAKANYVAQPLVATQENYVAQPVVAEKIPAQPFVTKSAFVAQPLLTPQHAAYVAQPFASQYVAQPAAYVAQPAQAAYFAQLSAKPEAAKTQADLLKTAAYVAQSAQPEQIRMNPAAETFEPVNKPAENAEDDEKQVDVDAIANGLAPTVLATRFAGSPVFTYYNPYVAQPVVV